MNDEEMPPAHKHLVFWQKSLEIFLAKNAIERAKSVIKKSDRCLSTFHTPLDLPLFSTCLYAKNSLILGVIHTKKIIYQICKANQIGSSYSNTL